MATSPQSYVLMNYVLVFVPAMQSTVLRYGYGTGEMEKDVTPSSLRPRLECWSGRLRTLPQPVRFLCHSHRMREEPGRSPSHLCPESYGSFSNVANARGNTLTTIVPAGICYLLS